ncbi:hypothetical protein TELCIR_00999 [Teladorsagia circumcincta]|uniref:Uncharacterized protein n=1 Tax=Teladorsagia circumcincta TaxID=45464 RepID=A0A2G9V334_TELCI|nr:hypothetical protein TELCIR_00999 [Teladorsagia circumcincta]
MAKQTRNVHVHFEAGLPDDDSTDSSDGESAPSVEEEPKSSNEPRTSSNHGISSRIQKRKMPVRRPTAYVSGRQPIQPKQDDKETAEQSSSSDTPPPSSTEGAKKSPTLEQRLRELSIKYKQQEQSPEREPSSALLKKPFTIVKK